MPSNKGLLASPVEFACITIRVRVQRPSALVTTDLLDSSKGRIVRYICELESMIMTPRRNQSTIRIALLFSLFALTGCSSPANVPPLEAKIELSNPRIDREFGSDILKVDYKFTNGLPKRGWQYQMQVTWPDGDTTETANYMNETQTTGTIEGELRVISTRNEPKTFNLKLLIRLLNPDAADYVPISNEVQISYTPQ